MPLSSLIRQDGLNLLTCFPTTVALGNIATSSKSQSGCGAVLGGCLTLSECRAFVTSTAQTTLQLVSFKHPESIWSHSNKHSIVPAEDLIKETQTT